MPLIGTNLSFSYPKGPRVLDAIDCSIEPASITAIVGPNGAGKSTLLRLLAGVTTPDQGDIHINESPLAHLTVAQRAGTIAYIAQRSTLVFDFDVRLVVSFGRLALPKDPSAIDRALDRFALTHHADNPMGTLSVGQQQRVSLARSFAQLDSQPHAYLLADEPTSAMDPKHQLRTMHAFRERASQGIGIALVAHDLTLAARFADRVVLMTKAGTIHAQGAAGEVLVPEILSRVFETPFGFADIQGQQIAIPLTNAAPSTHSLST